MASIKYFTKGTGTTQSIYIRFVHGRSIDYTRSTSLLVEKDYWNNKKGITRRVSEFKDKLNLDNDLNKLRTYLLNTFNDHYANGKIINSEWLSNSIKTFFDQNTDEGFIYFTQYAEYYKKTLKNKIRANGTIGVTKATETKFQTIINKLRAFESYKKKRLKVEDINLKFHKDFIEYLRTKEQLGFNTIGKYIEFVKTIAIDAKRYGLKISNDVDRPEFRSPKEPTTFITLNTKEVETIYNFDFSKTPYLDNARNWLIIGLWSGARANDLLKFTGKNVKDNFIEYTAQKTGQKIILPLHPQVTAILDANGGKFPRKISSQKFNDYIKKVCKDIGLTQKIEGAKNTKLKKGVWRKQKGSFPKHELVTTHICRRSFATNHYGKLPTPVLMAITGHTTEKMFLNYIGKTARDNAEVLNEFWKVQEQKRTKEPQLELIKNAQ